MPTPLENFIEQQRSMVERREIASAIAYWDAGMSATPELEERAAIASADLDSQYADPARYALLKSLPEPPEPELQRQRQILLDEFQRNQIDPKVIDEMARREMEIEGIFSNFRADLGGKNVSENDLKEILKTSNDSAERRAAWEAAKQIGGEVAGKVSELVAMRNREAKRLGYSDYYAMSIALQELDEAQLFETLEQVSSDLEPVFLRRKEKFDGEIAKRFGVSIDQIRPWHYSDPFFQQAPIEDEAQLDKLFEGRSLEEILATFCDAIGLRVRDLLPLSDLYEKPGKNQHAYCLSVGRGTGDVRVNCNLRPDATWMATLLHEFGHAVYDNELDPALPFFLKTVSHIMTTEAIAELMGRFVSNGAWLRRWVDVPAADAEQISKSANEALKSNLLVFTQWVMVITHFEREMYRSPDQDLGSLWWDLVAKYQHLTPPDDRSPTAWASKIHLATTPVYYHNYLLGEMIASQLLHTLRTTVVASENELVGSRKVGEWLTEKIFRPGARFAWNHLMVHATGEKLNPAYFVQEMSSS